MAESSTERPASYSSPLPERGTPLVHKELRNRDIVVSSQNPKVKETPEEKPIDEKAEQRQVSNSTMVTTQSLGHAISAFFSAFINSKANDNATTKEKPNLQRSETPEKKPIDEKAEQRQVSNSTMLTTQSLGHAISAFFSFINSKANNNATTKEKPNLQRRFKSLLKDFFLWLATPLKSKKGAAVVTTVLVAMLAIFLYCNFSFAEFHTSLCSTTLPQKESRFSPCCLMRSWFLGQQQQSYTIKSPTKSMPFARLHKSIASFFSLILVKPFIREHAFNWLKQAWHQSKVNKDYTTLARRLPQNMTMTDFDFINQNFQLHSDVQLEEHVQLPSLKEPFHQEKNDWITDKLFADQRLAGLNPMTLQKVTFSNKIGINWKILERMLNKTFDWNSAVSDVLEGKSLDTAISDGRIFVLQHHLCNGLETPQNKESQEPERTLWKYMSPITLFVSVPGKAPSTNPRLMPVAIQMDYKPDSSVYSPSDGDLWTLAKLNVQLTDLACSQIVEHLSKAHLVSEGLCLSFERQFSGNHPLYAMIKYHCRGVFTANTFGAPVLLEPDKELDRLFTYGAVGANEIVRRTSISYEWKDLDFETNIKQRGVDDRQQLPYYPYRDDGAEIHNTIKSMITDYVDVYYETDTDVEGDTELQNYANEVSDKGMLPGGAQIKIRGFPPSVESKKLLVSTLTQIMWLMSAQHSAVNYPLADYALHVPNMPCKLYDSTSVPNTTYSAERLPNRTEATDQAAFAMSLASYRHDRLFDYYEKLQDEQAKVVLLRHFKKLYSDVQPLLEKRNQERLAAGHLTYPYMLPRWIPNGIQT